MKIRASLASTGGIVLSGILLVLGVLTWFSAQADHMPIQFGLFGFLFLGLAVYEADAWSESLSLENGIIQFDSLLHAKKRINACAMADVLVVHEGLNQERGIISAVFREPDGTKHRLALGPLWRRRDLERFFASIEEATGECKLVEHVR
ncbi:hypothetical protein EDM68_03810 [Candidatus Uhrbacteria bacterium]|nr:MAG: hypothetical protein EDM68_03810 [Candidatus Uhrbacteria bacterium]